MSTFVLSFVVLALAIFGMAAGVLLGRKPIAGSCGGIGGSACASCNRPCTRRKQQETPTGEE